MFSNAAGKIYQGHFSNNFLEFLEKVNSRALVTDYF